VLQWGNTLHEIATIMNFRVVSFRSVYSRLSPVDILNGWLDVCRKSGLCCDSLLSRVLNKLRLIAKLSNLIIDFIHITIYLTLFYFSRLGHWQTGEQVPL